MTNYNDGKWHRWAGEDMKPASVHPKSKIEYIWLSDNSNSGRRTRVAGADEDESSPAWRQILAFRVIEEHREPREWWIGSDGMAYAEESLSPEPRIHVVEKLT